MAFGTITIKLRPIRFGFLVDPIDTAGLLEAIQTNSYLWGGMFNPIIPAYRRLPKNWEDHRRRSGNAQSIVSGYLAAFDPDYVVPMGRCAGRQYDFEKREVINATDLIGDLAQDEAPRYGVGLFEIIRYLLDEELKFVRRDPLEILLPIIPRRHHLFLASVFGSLPDAAQSLFDAHFATALQARTVGCSVSNYPDLLRPNMLFPRRMSAFGISQRQSKSVVFYLDPSDPLDIIDYWNLRAAGYYVIPVAAPASSLESIKRWTAEFVEQNYWPYQGNPSIYHRTSFIKSRSVSEQAVVEFAQSLNIPPNEEKGEPKFAIQRWYPRLWDEWARENTGERVEAPYVDETEVTVPEERDHIEFPTLHPEFDIGFSSGGSPRFANEITVRTFGAKEPIAEIIPEGTRELSDAIGRHHYHDWRFSRTGPVFLARYPKSRVFMDLPKAEKVILAWLREQGWSAELSPSGRIAKQMLIQLGGAWGSTLLAYEGIIKLLEELGSDRWLAEPTFRSRIQKIANRDRMLMGAERYCERLVEVGVFRPGLEMQCPVCIQRSWYPVDALSYELRCTKCLSTFPLPSQVARDTKWAYKPYGSFSLPKQAYGAFSLLLTLKFFARFHDRAITPLFSFIAKRDLIEIEADLALFYKEQSFGATRLELIFAECKTYNRFEPKDMLRMRQLADAFPGAILVFSTLRNSLASGEIRLLRPLVNRGRKYWKAERPFNPVMILTGTELFSSWGTPECWKGKGERFEDIYKHHEYMRNLLELCDVTQQLYLNMNPWHEWLEKRWQRRRLQSDARRIRGAASE